MRILSSSSSDDGEDGNGDDDEDNDGSDGNGAYGGTYGVGGSQWGGVMSWDPNYHATHDPNSRDDYSSGQDNYSRGYHSLEGHMQGLDLTSGYHYGVGYDYGLRSQL